MQSSPLVIDLPHFHTSKYPPIILHVLAYSHIIGGFVIDLVNRKWTFYTLSKIIQQEIPSANYHSTILKRLFDSCHILLFITHFIGHPHPENLGLARDSSSVLSFVCKTIACGCSVEKVASLDVFQLGYLSVVLRTPEISPVKNCLRQLRCCADDRFALFGGNFSQSL